MLDAALAPGCRDGPGRPDAKPWSGSLWECACACPASSTVPRSRSVRCWWASVTGCSHGREPTMPVHPESHQSESSPKDFEAERRGVQDRSGTAQSWMDISGYGQWLSAKTWLGSKANIAPVRSRVRNLVPVTRPGPKPGHEPEHGIGFTQQSDAVPGVDHERLLGSGTATLRPVSRDWTAASAMARAARPSVPSE